ncbi:MAG: hypothetical protein OXH97_09055 [Chloroflexota bacterium]|nr:hypothetical protein [Chloroflexota bacterium]
MSSGEIRWHFPPTGGGVAMGYNDPGIAHFGGAREQSLARETIQNSLDAAARLGTPVDVEFDLHVHDDDWFAKAGLAATIQHCLVEAKTQKDEKASRAFEEAAQLLDEHRLTFLRVADRNTTGLHGEKWDALLKRPGVSVHDQRGAGGSWGIGKNAPFTLSPLRTVFYWTRFEEDGEAHERFQGKAVLMAHESEGKERQSTGFFGVVDGCQAVDGDAIPEAIRDVESGVGRRVGTSLWIAGFQERDGWQERIARRVAASFFGAIQDRTLTVTIEPSDGMRARELIDIKAENLGEWFEYLEQDSDVVQDDEDDDIDDAQRFWELLQGDHTAECQDRDLGHCRLWVAVSDDAALPNKVGLMRKTGMLITARQLGLIRFRGMRDFIAICRFEGDEGNELLRKMENPRHDQFEPERIENDPKEEQRGRAALKRISEWIREEIRKVAAPDVPMEAARLSELDRLLPDIAPEEPFGDDSGDGDEREPSFGSAPVVKLKPRRRPAPPMAQDPDEYDHADPEEDTEVIPIGNGGGGGGGGGEPRPPSQKRKRLLIDDVRLVPVRVGANRYRVSFRPREAGVANIVLAEAGDSTLVSRGDVQAWQDGAPFSLSGVELRPPTRIEFEITASSPLGARAWVVSAVAPEIP